MIEEGCTALVIGCKENDRNVNTNIGKIVTVKKFIGISVEMDNDDSVVLDADYWEVNQDIQYEDMCINIIKEEYLHKLFNEEYDPGKVTKSRTKFKQKLSEQIFHTYKDAIVASIVNELVYETEAYGTMIEYYNHMDEIAKFLVDNESIQEFEINNMEEFKILNELSDPIPPLIPFQGILKEITLPDYPMLIQRTIGERNFITLIKKETENGIYSYQDFTEVHKNKWLPEPYVLYFISPGENIKETDFYKEMKHIKFTFSNSPNLGLKTLTSSIDPGDKEFLNTMIRKLLDINIFIYNRCNS